MHSGLSWHVIVTKANIQKPFTLFISDLHLDPSAPEITRAFERTLHGPAREADALYILGDLFEVWVGDDDLNSFNRHVIELLQQFTSTSHVPTYFIHGNRDFLIGKRFAKLTGITILPESVAIDLYGKKTVLLHGDTLCTDDNKYQQFRKKTHHPLFKPCAYAIPLALRRKIAQKMRAKSMAHFQLTNKNLMDVSPEAVEKVMQSTQADFMIHGHTHRPKIHDHRRAVLGPWHKKAYLLYVSADGIRLDGQPL